MARAITAGKYTMGGGYTLTHVTDNHGYVVLGGRRGATLAEVDAYLDGGHVERDAERLRAGVEAWRHDVEVWGGHFAPR